MTRLNAELGILRNRAGALHGTLYDRPVPVNDAAMLTDRIRLRIVSLLSLFTAAACFAGNLTTFVRLGWTFVGAALAGLFMTALPVGLGHLAYEKVVAERKWLHVPIILIIMALLFAALYELGQARRAVIDKATEPSATTSYVEDGAVQDAPTREKKNENREAKVHGTLGAAAFFVTMAAELGLGYLVGLLTLRTDEDYAA